MFLTFCKIIFHEFIKLVVTISVTMIDLINLKRKILFYWLQRLKKGCHIFFWYEYEINKLLIRYSNYT